MSCQHYEEAWDWWGDYVQWRVCVLWTEVA
jgi:hypothetical protein